MMQRKEWSRWNEDLKAQLLKEEKKRLTEQKVAISEIAEAASAQQDAEDKVCVFAPLALYYLHFYCGPCRGTVFTPADPMLLSRLRRLPWHLML